jgi:hypothetical protein
MKRAQQVNSRRWSKMARRTRRAKSRQQQSTNEQSKRITIILFPGEMSADDDALLRVAVDQILAPLGRPFTPQTWEEQKNGAIVELSRPLARRTIGRLSQLKGLGMMIFDGRHIQIINFDEGNLP